MSRVDLFQFAHKGLRHAMFAAASRLAVCDLRDPAATGAAAADVRATLSLLREHADHEDAVIFPAIAASMPSLASGLRAEHLLIEGHEARLEPLLTGLLRSDCSERAAIGRRLLGQWHVVVAAHLTHMHREEVEGNRTLHANLDDAQLLALHRRVLATIPTARRVEWQQLIRPALSPLDLELLDATLDGSDRGARSDA